MNTPASGLFDGQQGLAKAYPGGRAQAESGSKIIENDYDAWKAVSVQVLPASHTLVLQFGRAWKGVSTLGLGDGVGAASIRYQVLAHAARALAPATAGREADALLNLWRHARIHGQRLYATGLDRFLGSSASSRYGGFAQAAAESANVEKQYHALLVALTSIDNGFATGVSLLRKAWAGIEQHDLMDGSEAAAGRYRAIAQHAGSIAEDMAPRLPSAVLIPLLELAAHANKHSIRLYHTAAAIRSGTADRSAPYRGLPVRVTAAATQGHIDIPRDGRAAVVATGAAAPQARKQDQQRGA
jgi:hypothetical protein